MKRILPFTLLVVSITAIAIYLSLGTSKTLYDWNPSLVFYKGSMEKVAASMQSYLGGMEIQTNKPSKAEAYSAIDQYFDLMTKQEDALKESFSLYRLIRPSAARDNYGIKNKVITHALLYTALLPKDGIPTLEIMPEPERTSLKYQTTDMMGSNASLYPMIEPKVNGKESGLYYYLPTELQHSALTLPKGIKINDDSRLYLLLAEPDYVSYRNSDNRGPVRPFASYLVLQLRKNNYFMQVAVNGPFSHELSSYIEEKLNLSYYESEEKYAFPYTNETIWQDEHMLFLQKIAFQCGIEIGPKETMPVVKSPKK